MRKQTLRIGLLVGLLLAMPLMAIMYLANQLAGLPFVPFDLFDWVTRVLPGPIITFGIDLMIDTLTLIGLDVADTAKTAEQISAVLQFLAIGVITGLVFFAVMAGRRFKADIVAGLVTGALLGLPILPSALPSANLPLTQFSVLSGWLFSFWVGASL